MAFLTFIKSNPPTGLQKLPLNGRALMNVKIRVNDWEYIFKLFWHNGEIIMRCLPVAAILCFLIGTYTTASASNSHVEAELGQRGDLSIFYQALLNTGVARELNENTKYTIFAPTNAAFEQINPRVYPCFYAVLCRSEVAAVLRGHIVPGRETLHRYSEWGGDIPTLSPRRLNVEEPYKGEYTVNGHRVLYRDDLVGLYEIDGVIAGDRELAFFRKPVPPEIPGTVTEKTITTTRTIIVPPEFSSGYFIPGGYPAVPPLSWPPNESNSSIDSTTVITHPNH
jgi:uncharacterized surface protein with fasciclin (FAS1) repeats